MTRTPAPGPDFDTLRFSWLYLLDDERAAEIVDRLPGQRRRSDWERSLSSLLAVRPQSTVKNRSAGL